MLHQKIILLSLLLLMVTPACFGLGITQEFGEPPEPEVGIQIAVSPTPTLIPTIPPPPTATPAPTEIAYSLEIILGPHQEVGVITADDLDDASRIIIDRLVDVGFGLSLTTDYDAEEITLLTTGTSEVAVPLVTQTGFLELVDFSGMEDIPVEGDCVLTSAQEERYPNQPLCLSLDSDDNPLTAADGSPFETVITGDGVTEATAALAADSVGQWQVTITLDGESGETLGAFTEEHIGEPLAIVLDGEVISVPVIQARVDEQAVISGNFTALEAQHLARILNSDALPFSVQMIGIDLLP
jgi:preprotein translocase subunit SecD